MIRAEKKDQVSKIEEIYKSSEAVIITHYHGMTVGDLNNLRSDLRSNGAGFKVVKNTLSKIAADNLSLAYDPEMFSGPTAIAYSEDPVAAAKSVVNFAKTNNNLKVIGGMVGGQVVELSEVEKLAKLPSLDELRGKIIAVLQAPATNIVRVLSAPASQVARVIKAHAEK